MPTIADQVASLEHDHNDALAKIDALNATNAALMDALSAITAEKAALEARIAELSMRNDGMVAMVEKVASSALDMLKAARLPAGTPAEVIPFAPKLKTVNPASVAPSVGFADVLITEEMLGPEPAGRAVAQAIANDTVVLPAILASASLTVPRLVPSRPPKPAAVPIIEPMSAVDRIKRHFLPAVTLMRRPIDLTMRVKDDPPGLPMFLRRDTVFARVAAHC
jgi:hypothetical protein